MGFDFGLAKRQLKRTVHDTLSVTATLRSVAGGAVNAVQVRYHEKLVRTGSADAFDGTVSEIIEGVDRLIFDADDLAARSIVLRRGDVVLIPSLSLGFQLDTVLPPMGPVITGWQVTSYGGS